VQPELVRDERLVEITPERRFRNLAIRRVEERLTRR
jgi:hypothetical protein